jgi:PAS domain S-box-containing protein
MRTRLSISIGVFIQALLLALLVGLTGLSSAHAQPASAPNSKKVLILFTHESSQPAQVIIEDALRSTLRKNSPVPIEIYSEYLDGVRTNVDDYENEMVGLLHRKYGDKQIDLIFAINPPALKLILKDRPGLFPNTSIVFIVLDQRVLADLDLSTKVTGVWGEVNFKATLETALSLHPGTKRVVVISGVGDWDVYWRTKAHEDFRAFADRVEITDLIGLTVSEQLKALASLPPNTIAIFASSTQDSSGNRPGNLEVIRQIGPVSSVPIYGSSDAQLGLGIVGGHVVSFEAMGAAGARDGLRILAGEKAENIAPHGVPSVLMFDWRELRRWGISEKQLPAGSVVRFKEPSLWESYKNYLIGLTVVVLVQSLLVGLLLFERRRRRRATEDRRHLADIVQSSDDAIFSRSLDGTILSWNRGAELMYGYRADEMVGVNVAMLAPPERRREIADIIERIKSGENVNHFETVRRTKDGREINVSLTASALKDETGALIGASIVARDITERKQIADALEENQAQLAGIIGSAMDSIMTVDDQQLIVLFNEAAERSFGCSAAEAIGQPLERFVPERFRVAQRENIEHFGATSVSRQEMGLPGGLWALRASGEEFPVEASISQLELKGRKYSTFILRDITQRRLAEEELIQSESRFRNMADTAPVMIWISGADQRCNYFNQQWLDFTGRSLEQELGDGWLEGVHVDDRADCLETFSSSFDRRERFEMEYRLQAADGSYRWVLDCGTPRFSSSGEFLGFIGSSLDISARKEAEAELRMAHEQLSELKNQLEAENIYLQEELQSNHAFGEIVGQSDAIKHVLYKINQVAATDSTVLIMGETGTGKELVARALHAASNRKDRPLIRVNCAALTPTLIESELFGHEKGAFSGAATRKLGRFELANGGTLFLDEIGELPLESQSKLLRVLQEGELERVGGTKTIKVDIRIVAATNRDLKVNVEKGTFRQDLWYRLNVFPITAPPLRQRRDDIPLLAEHFVKLSAKKFGKNVTSISVGMMHSLKAHSWPGNVRELANVIERALIHNHGGVLRLADRFEATPQDEPQSVRSLEEMEREYITRILENTSWRVEGSNGAARVLGLKPSTLRDRMVKLRIQRQSANSA